MNIIFDYFSSNHSVVTESFKKLTENWKKVPLLISAARKKCCHQFWKHNCYELFWCPPPTTPLYQLYSVFFDELKWWASKEKEKNKIISWKKNQIKTISSIQDDNKQTVRSQVQIYDAWRCRCGQNFNYTVRRLFLKLYFIIYILFAFSHI